MAAKRSALVAALATLAIPAVMLAGCDGTPAPKAPEPGGKSATSSPAPTTPSAPKTEEARMILDVPAGAKSGDQIDLHITLGPVPKQTRVNVRAVSDNSVIATIFPFGKSATQDAGTFVVSVPVTAARNGKLEVRFEFDSDKKGEAPTATAAPVVKGAKLETPPGK